MSEQETHSAANGGGLPADDRVMPFQVDGLGARGRVVRLGAAATEILERHDYPEPVSRLLAEALSLTAMLGASLKFDGKFILQTKTDGPVDMIVVDYATPDRLRGYAHFDSDRLGETMARDTAEQSDFLGRGHLALTIDQGPNTDRYQGVVALDGTSLEDAAHTYFEQSEQIPTRLKLAAAPLYRQGADTGRPSWRTGGIMVQYLPEDGGVRVPDLHPGDAPEGVEVEEAGLDDDRWNRATILLDTVEDHELLDPTLSSERLLYRLYHEDGVRAFEPRDLRHECGCSRGRIETMLLQFSPEDRAGMVEDGRISVTCEFCNRLYTFEPDEIGDSAG